MKTKLIMKSISVLVILIFAVSLSHASVNNRKPVTDLKTMIKNSVTYPEIAKKNQLSGFVLVSFNLDTNGKINVSEINANSIFLRQYVENKFKEIKIENPKTYSDNTFYYRFDFKLIS